MKLSTKDLDALYNASREEKTSGAAKVKPAVLASKIETMRSPDVAEKRASKAVYASRDPKRQSK